jgi:competence protein ComK
VQERRRMIEEYEVNPHTMLLFPIKYGSKIYTEVFELSDQFLSPFKPLDIVKKSCEFFGSSYEGRRQGAKQLIGSGHKPPIIVDPHTSIFLFPTMSPSKQECIWISHEHVISHERLDTNTTSVTFRNKQTFRLPVSYSVFNSQLLRTALLRTRLSQRMEEMERRAHFIYFPMTKTKAAEHVHPYTWSVEKKH